MSDAGGLRIDVAAPQRRHDRGALTVDETADADVPFRFGDAFPFADRGVASIAAGSGAGALGRAAQLHFLLECRRVLRPGGSLAIDCAPAAPVREALATLARMAGLAPAAAQRDDTLVLTKPPRTLAGEPLVTIAIPAYGPRYFGAALDSALAQTYANVEIVVCDDARDDAIERQVRARAHARPLRYLRNPERLRVRANYLRCFDEARGDLVKFLCDDDLLAPTCVARLVDAFRAAPDVVLATSRRLRIDAAGAVLPDQPATLPIVARDALIEGRSLANAMLMSGLNMIGEPSTALFRKADLADDPPPRFNFAGAPGHGVIDMVMWSALLLKGDAVYLVEPQSAFRVHAGQRQHDPAMAQRNVDSIRALQSAWQALELDRRGPAHILETQPLPPPPDGEWTPRQVLSFSVRADAAAPASAAPPR